MKRILLASLFISAMWSTPANASTIIFTFSDPGATMFSWDAQTAASTDGTLNGGWSGTGLTLCIGPNGCGAGSTQYSDATFTMTQLSANGITDPDSGRQLVAAGVGNLTFFDSSSVAILKIDFSRAWINTLAFGNADLNVDAGDIVNIYSPTGPDLYLGPESFGFSFTSRNPSTGSLNNTNVTWTSSFTSSAELASVPEPTSMLLLGTGLLGAAAAARRRMKKRQ